MTAGNDNSENSTMVHLIVDGKYVIARMSKESKEVELFLVETQGEVKQDGVKCFTREETTEVETKKYVAFHFKYRETWYSLKIEGETLTLVDSTQPHDWLERVDIKAGESHHLRTTAGEKIGVPPDSGEKFKLGVGGNPVIFQQVCAN